MLICHSDEGSFGFVEFLILRLVPPPDYMKIHADPSAFPGSPNQDRTGNV